MKICDCAWYEFAGDSVLFMSAEQEMELERERLERVAEAYGDVGDIDDSDWEAENDLT